MTYREVARKLKSLGCVESPRTGGGSHRKWKNPSAGRASIVPDWGGNDLKLGTIRGVVRQLALDWDSFQSAGLGWALSSASYAWSALGP